MTPTRQQLILDYEREKSFNINGARVTVKHKFDGDEHLIVFTCEGCRTKVYHYRDSLINALIDLKYVSHKQAQNYFDTYRFCLQQKAA